MGKPNRYCDNCYCSDWDCRRDCRKCSYNNYSPNGWSSGSSSSSGSNNWSSGSTSSSVNCRTCSCSNYSCRNGCSRCYSSNNNNNSYGFSSSSGGNYNNGWRSGVNGRAGEDSEASEVVVESSSSDQKENSDGEVVFA